MIKRIKQNKIWSLSPFSILIFNRDSPEEQTRGEEDKKSEEDDKIEENDSMSAER